VASGALHVVGMFFDLSTARVHEVDKNGLVARDEPVGTR
jgi:carbonic anhydrase